MATIHLTTLIKAPVDRVFDLSRSVNLHKISLSDSGEKAIGGVLNGLIDMNETVTWQGRHLYKVRKFTSRITAMEKPVSFTDEMTEGDFQQYKHEHHFKPINNGTIMIDLVSFESPYAIVGKIFNRVYLTRYMKNLLIKRNEVIKEYAETQKWKAILS
jgi:ligand-binding SRPBCC domain-containing protein